MMSIEVSFAPSRRTSCSRDWLASLGSSSGLIVYLPSRFLGAAFGGRFDRAARLDRDEEGERAAGRSSSPPQALNTAPAKADGQHDDECLLRPARFKSLSHRRTSDAMRSDSAVEVPGRGSFLKRPSSGPEIEVPRSCGGRALQADLYVAMRHKGRMESGPLAVDPGGERAPGLGRVARPITRLRSPAASSIVVPPTSPMTGRRAPPARRARR